MGKEYRKIVEVEGISNFPGRAIYFNGFEAITDFINQTGRGTAAVNPSEVFEETTHAHSGKRSIVVRALDAAPAAGDSREYLESIAIEKANRVLVTTYIFNDENEVSSDDFFYAGVILADPAFVNRVFAFVRINSVTGAVDVLTSVAPNAFTNVGTVALTDVNVWTPLIFTVNLSTRVIEEVRYGSETIDGITQVVHSDTSPADDGFLALGVILNAAENTAYFFDDISIRTLD